MGDTPSFALDDNDSVASRIPQRPSYGDRIQRAHDLAERYSSSAELLRFYAQLAFHQQQVFESLLLGSELPCADSWPLLQDPLLPLFPGFARGVAEIAPAPAPVREHAANLARSGVAEQIAFLTKFWSTGFSGQGDGENESTAVDRFIALGFLQPYAEWLAQFRQAVPGSPRHATCPVCSSEPACAVLREQDHGARRDLICSVCMNEWTFERRVCPGCGEDRFKILPVFTPEETPHVRIDACDTCKHYIKTVDMTKDGLAVPVVDELAAVSLDLWAREQGYIKLRTNLVAL